MSGKKKKKDKNVTKKDKNVTKKDKVKFIKSLQEIYESKKGFNKVKIKEETNNNSSANDTESNSNFYVYRGCLIPQQKSLFESGLFIDNIKNIKITKIFKNVKLRRLLDENKMDKEYLMEQYALFQSLYPYYLAKYGLNLEKNNEIFIGPYMKYTNKNNIEIEKNFNSSSQMTFAIQTHSYIPDQLHGGIRTAALKALQSSGSMDKLKKQAEKRLPDSMDELKKQAEKVLPDSMDELKKQAEKVLPDSMDELKKQAEKVLPDSMDKLKKQAEKVLPDSMDYLNKQVEKTVKENFEKSDNVSKDNENESQHQNTSESKKQNENSVINAEAVKENFEKSDNVSKDNENESQHQHTSESKKQNENSVINAEAVEVEEARSEIVNNNVLSENGTNEVSPENVSILNVDENTSRQVESYEENTMSYKSSLSSSQSNQNEIEKMVKKHETEIQELKSSQKEALQNNDNEIKLYTIHSFNSFNNLCTNRDGVLLVLCFLSMNHNQRINLIQGNFFKNGKPVIEVLKDFYEIYKDTTATTEKTVELGLKHYFGFNEKLDKEAKKEIRAVIKESNKKPSLFKRLFGKKSKGGTKKKVKFTIKNKSKKDHLRIIKLKKKPKYTTKLYKNKNKLKMTRKNIK
jgi:hypothetical protein